MSLEYTEMIVLNLQATNSNQTDSTPTSSNVLLVSSPIVDNMNDWDLYFKSLYLTTAEIPYMNALRNASFIDTNYAQNNFSCNRLNLAVTLVQVAGNAPFISTNATALANSSLMYFENPSGVQPTHYSTCGSFVQYISENSIAQTPSGNSTSVSSVGYSRGYWSIHSIQQFLDMINSAINRCLVVGGLPAYSIYYSFIPTTGLYQLVMTDAILPANGIPLYNLYMNQQCERYFDYFRWAFQEQYTNLLHPPQSLAKGGYIGAYSNCMDYQFVPSIQQGIYTAPAVGTPYWTFFSDNNCVPLMIDVHSLLISVVQGDLINARSQVIPVSTAVASANNSLLPPTKKVIKIIDINPDAGAGINNATLIATADVAIDAPINLQSRGPLQSIQLAFELMTCDNIIIPISIPSGTGWAGIRVFLKRKKNVK